MRVLHLIEGSAFGGVESVLLTLARERRLCPEMRPHFAVCSEGRFSRELRASGSPVDYLGEVTRNPFTVLRARSALDRVLAQESIDAVVSHSPWAHGMFAPVIKTRAIPMAFWAHRYLTGRNWRDWWARRTPPALVICNSSYTGTGVRNLFPGVALQVVHYPASQQAPDLNPEAPVLILPQMERGRHGESLDGFEILGGGEDDVLELLFIEAMQRGLPIVTTDEGPAREFIDESCGILVAPNQPALLKDALRDLLADEPQRARLAGAGPARAAAFSDPAKQLDRLKQVLQATRSTAT